MQKTIDYLRFFKAVKKGSVSRVQEFLQEGLEIDYVYPDSIPASCYNKTALMVAVQYGRKKICEMLLSQGANSAMPSTPIELRGSNTALLIALQKGDMTLLKVLITKDKNDLGIIERNFWQHKNMTQEILLTVVSVGAAVPDYAIVYYMNKYDKFIEELIKRGKSVSELKSIVYHGANRESKKNFYLPIFEQYVHRNLLKEVLDSETNDFIKESGLYKALAILEEKKQMQEISASNRYKRVVKI